MNASGRLNTCKSNVATHGARVRNAYATYLLLGNNPAKAGIIPHNIFVTHVIEIKDLSVIDGHASD